MKFEIYGTEFKSLIDRISGIVPKRTALPSLETVKITAEGNTLTLHATDVDNHGVIKMRTEVYENGVKWVFLKDLKKVLGISDLMTVTANGNIFEVRSKKKSYEIPCHDFADSWFNLPVLENNNVMCRQHDDEFLTHLSKLNNLRSENDNNRMMCSFCIDLPERKIVTLDGHRIGVAHLEGGMFSPSCKRLIAYGTLYNGLKSLIGKTKTQNYIEISADDKTIKFEGKDWIYITKMVEGQYFRFEHMFSQSDTDYDYTYRFNNKELGKIAKEYKKALSADVKKPMLFYNNDGKIATGIEVDDYRTSDVIEVVPEYGMGHEWYIGVNPQFIVDACNVFDGEVTAKGRYKANAPFVFKDDTYDVLILPVNTSEANYSFVRKQVA